MVLKTTRFIALLFTALALGSALAHLLELPNKIGLSRDEYLTVQQIYQGWAMLGIVEAVSLLSVSALAVMVRQRRRSFVWALIAALCIAATLIVFFALTFPTNQQTSNWTALPTNWQELRVQWEYSHAARAVLYLTAFAALALSVLARDERAIQDPAAAPPRAL
jgi:cbb3-type cytochrome oxidase subunit 1